MSDTATRSIVGDAIAAFEQQQREMLAAFDEVRQDNLRQARLDACEKIKDVLGMTTLTTSWEYQNENLITYPLDDEVTLGFRVEIHPLADEREFVLVQRCPRCQQWIATGSRIDGLVALGRALEEGEPERHKIGRTPCNYVPKQSNDTVEDRLISAFSEFIESRAPEVIA